MLSGRDRAKVEGGTWLGISKDHKVGLMYVSHRISSSVLSDEIRQFDP